MEEKLQESLEQYFPDELINIVGSYGKNLIISASNDTTIKIWDVYTGNCLQTLKGHFGEVTCISYNHRLNKLVSGSSDKTIRIWDVETGKCLLILKGHSEDIWCVSWCSYNGRIVSGSMHGSIQIWDIDDACEIKKVKCLQTIKQYGNVSCVEWDPFFQPEQGRLPWIASGSFNNEILIWDVADKYDDSKWNENGYVKCFKKLQKDPWNGNISSWVGITSLSWCNLTQGPERKTRIVTGRTNNTIQIWDVENGKCLHVLKEHSSNVKNVSCYNKGGMGLIASGSYDNCIKIWDMEIGQCLQTLEGHSDGVTSVSWNDSGDKIVSGSRDNCIKIWDVDNNGKCIHTLNGHSDEINSVLFI